MVLEAKFDGLSVRMPDSGRVDSVFCARAAASFIRCTIISTLYSGLTIFTRITTGRCDCLSTARTLANYLVWRQGYVLTFDSVKPSTSLCASVPLGLGGFPVR